MGNLKQRLDKRIQQVDRVAVLYHFSFHSPQYHNQPFKAECNVCKQTYVLRNLTTEFPSLLRWINEHSTHCDLRGAE